MSEAARKEKDRNTEALPSLVAAFTKVGLPLIQAMAEQAANKSETPPTDPVQAETMAALIDSTLALNQALAGDLGDEAGKIAPWVRWALVGASSQVVASHFKTSGTAMSAEQAKQIATLASTLQSKFKAQIPADNEPLPNTVATFRAKMLEAMVPVVGAVAQYSFGRAEHALVAEIAERLVRTADQITRTLAPTGATAEQWRLLCWHVLKASGQIYTESHYAEADRLLYMSPEERAAYFAQHGQILPMTQVWQSFNQRMAMLATLATYLEPPPSAQRDMTGWETT